MLTLNDICTLITDGSHFSPEDEGKGYPMLSVKDMCDDHFDTTDCKYVGEEAFQKLVANGCRPQVNDVVVAKDGSFLKTAFTVKEDQDIALLSSIAILRPRLDIIVPDYLSYYLKSPSVYRIVSLNYISGTALKRIILKGLRKIPMEVPTIEEQQHRVNLLNSIQSIIKQRQIELQKLDELIKARFVELFGDPITNPKGYTKITVAEAIEDGYIEKPFDGNHGSKHPKASEYVESGIPFLMANNVICGTVDQVHCSFITEERANRLDKGFAKDKDVLITHKGTIGRTAVLRTDYEFVMLTPQVAAYRVKDGITPDYLCGYFATEFFQNDIKLLAAAGGSTRAYAGITAQLQLNLIIPPLNEQKVYTDFIKQVDKSKFVRMNVNIAC